MNEYIRSALAERYNLKSRDMGEFRKIKKNIYRIECECYEIEGVGNLFFIDMKAMMGMMKMESMVLTPLWKDVSFCNFDLVEAAGNTTLIFEMYRTALHEDDLGSFAGLKEKYRNIENAQTDSGWYDAMKLSCCLAKKGKSLGVEKDRVIADYLDKYMQLLEQAADCDPEAKKAAVRCYTDRLVTEGGVAVDTMKQMLGPEKTAKLIRSYMYGID